jgi:hypothetical protein
MRQRLASLPTVSEADAEAARVREEELRRRWRELDAAAEDARRHSRQAEADYLAAIQARRLAEERAGEE